MASGEPDYTRLLAESLEALAAAAQVQIAYIDHPGLSADDLAEDHGAPATHGLAEH